MECTSTAEPSFRHEPGGECGPTAMAVIYAVDDFKQRRQRAAARAQAEFEDFKALCRGVPRGVIEAIVAALDTQSEKPLHQLPPQWRGRCIAAFRQIAARKAEHKPIDNVLALPTRC
jgi:hypothetical protein